MNIEIATLLIRLAIAVFTALVAPAVRAWLAAKTDNEKLNQLKSAAETAVYAAEQMYAKIADNPDYQQERRKFAHDTISRAAHRLGFVLTESEINALLEAAVQELNQCKGSA